MIGEPKTESGLAIGELLIGERTEVTGLIGNGLSGS